MDDIRDAFFLPTFSTKLHQEFPPSFFWGCELQQKKLDASPESWCSETDPSIKNWMGPYQRTPK